MSSETYLIVEHYDHWLEVTLNRPANFNALSNGMLDALLALVSEVSTQDDLHCMIIKATGKAFCAGHDLKEMNNNTSRDYYAALFDKCSLLMQSIVNLPIPVIAEVQGVATAAGCQLVATCDLAVASNNARFAVSGINLGLFCSTPAVALSRAVPRKKALEMLFTGDFITAQDALSHGLINRVTKSEELTNCTRELAAAICSKNPAAVRTGKAMFYPQAQCTLTDAYILASRYMVDNLMQPSTQKQIDGFANKNKKS